MKRISIVCIALFIQLAHLQGALLTNNAYILDAPIGVGLSDYSITVTLPITADPDQIVPSQILKPEFTVLFSSVDPGYSAGTDCSFLAPGTSVFWSNNAYRVPRTTLLSILNSTAWKEMTKKTVDVTDDAVANRSWYLTPYPNGGTVTTISGTTSTGAPNIYAQGTTFPFYVGQKYVMTPISSEIDGTGTTVGWTFPSNALFSLTANVHLATAGGEPRINYRLIPKSTSGGYYSVAFTGCPKFAKTTPMVPVPQDALYVTEALYNHVVPENMLKLPRVQVTSPTDTWGAALMVDPSYSDFLNPDGTIRAVDWRHSTFAMMMSNVDQAYFPIDFVQPIAFTPIMGGTNSFMTSSSPDYFCTLRYVQRLGDFTTIQQYIAQSFGVSDYRDNTGTGSLNRTLDRILAYLGNYNGNNYAYWDPEQKYYEYHSDMPGTFKPFSPLYGLSAAIVMDDETFYRTRALPAVEYGLSRKGNAFEPYDVEDTAHLNSSRELGAPFLNSTQLASLDNIYQRRNELFYSLAMGKGFSDADFAQLLAKYSITDDVADFNAAVSRAKAKLASAGWRCWAVPQDWLDLYQYSTPLPAGASADAVTYYPQFAPSARFSIYDWVSHEMILSPAVVSGTITHDPGGVAPLHIMAPGSSRRLGYPKPVGFPIPPEKQGPLPAWRLALNGLDNQGYPQLWMDDYGRLMRIAALQNDTFLKNVSRMGMVGRFANFPGDNRVAPSVVMEDPNLPENPRWMLMHSTWNPGHAWELIGEVIDFLVSDFYYTSNKQISFPWRSMKGSGNPFQVSLYGDRPGTFYADANVRLWMPVNLFTINNPQIDYISGYGTGAYANTLYVAFVNRSASTQVFTANANTNRATFLAGTARRWLNNSGSSNYALSTANQITNFSLGGKGIVAFAIPNTTFAARPIHDKMFSALAPTLTLDNSYKTAALPSPYTGANTVYGMLLSLGKGLTTAFVYSDAQAANTISATLTYQQGTTIQTIVDKIFPYEFSFPYDDTAGGPLQCTFTIKDKNSVNYSTTVTLYP